MRGLPAREREGEPGTVLPSREKGRGGHGGSEIEREGCVQREKNKSIGKGAQQHSREKEKRGFHQRSYREAEVTGLKGRSPT